MKLECKSKRKSVVEFWPGLTAEVNIAALQSKAIPVKGITYQRPERFLEIYANTQCDSGNKMPWEEIVHYYLPRIPGVAFELSEHVHQPPFAWREASVNQLAFSFTYNTNAFYRILSLLATRKQIQASQVDKLLDAACLTLSRLYRAERSSLIRNINNNLNMYLISKVIERLVGKDVYDAELQELDVTSAALAHSLSQAHEHMHLSPLEKMGIALGKGVSFTESRMKGGCLDKSNSDEVRRLSYQYYNQTLAIDHRNKLLKMIEDGGYGKNSFRLVAILDDATETVDDLLWIQDLLTKYQFLQVQLLVNTAQISINFSSHMLNQVWAAKCFYDLRLKFGSSLSVTEIYCPFISFQTNYLPPVARHAIETADAVFVKGANFFETCQILDKETFHSFVVFGPNSRFYTGLSDYAAIFAHVPVGAVGYEHGAPNGRSRSLLELIGKDAH